MGGEIDLRNIIIAGGGLVNKGAQAMTLISVCELKKRYPDHRILLLAWNTDIEEQEHHAIYELELLQIPPMKFAKAAKSPLKKALFGLRYRKAFLINDEIYRNTDMLIDVSGYALGSNWPAKVCNDFLDNLEFAIAYNIPIILMPQSFGPFDYMGDEGKKIDVRIRYLFPQIKQIYAREREGYDALVSRYGLTNVTLLNDMVLASRLRDYSAALREKVKISVPEIHEKSICVIPNVRVGDNDVNDIHMIYKTVIETSLQQGVFVYITYHSTQDISLCQILKKEFEDNDRVILLNHDYSCIEFNELVKRFRFVIASRFHAIVHALKNGIPCVALGWAVKYIDLLNLFEQGEYLVDLRSKINPKVIQEIIIKMNMNYLNESRKIKNTLPELQKKNAFDIIEEI